MRHRRRQREQTGFGPALTDKIGQSYPVIRAAHQVKTPHCAQQRFELRHAIQVADGVLRQGLWPAAHYRFRGLRQRAEDAA